MYGGVIHNSNRLDIWLCYLADHVMGVVPFLRNLLYPPRTDETLHFPQVTHAWLYPTLLQRLTTQRTVDLYGPPGLRLFVRQSLKMTLTRTADTYRVHELLTPEDSLTPCVSAHKDDMSRMDPSKLDVMHYSEFPGSDIISGEDGLWRNIAATQGQPNSLIADAAPILHRGILLSKRVSFRVWSLGPPRSLFWVCLYWD